MNKKLLWGLGVAVAAVGAFLYFQPQEKLASPEILAPDNQMAEPSIVNRTAGDDTLAKVSVPAEFSADALIGMRGYEAKCAACHGINAAGQDEVAPPLVHTIYRPGHHPDNAFVRAAMQGVTSHHWNFGNVPPVQGLTAADIKYIARYIRELQQENGIN